MKEYILVILSGICKAVEKTKWPEDKRSNCEKHFNNLCFTKSDCLCTEEYERQKREAFEGGALVHWCNIPAKLIELEDGAYPIDPLKWDIVEQWEAKKNLSGFTWISIKIQELESYNRKTDYQTRLTAIIKPKPKENSAHAQEPVILICENCKRYWYAPKTECVCGCKTLSLTHPSNITKVEPQPTIATDSSIENCPLLMPCDCEDECVLQKGYGTSGGISMDTLECIKKSHNRDMVKRGIHPSGENVMDSAQAEPQEPTRKLVTEELIEFIKSNEPLTLYDKALIAKVQSLKAKEIENLKHGFNQGYREGEHDGKSCVDNEKDVSEYNDALNYITQTYQPKP